MRLYKVAHMVESKAITLSIVAVVIRYTIELIENATNIPTWNAYATILNRNLYYMPNLTC